jgi:tripartite-type tricarboxylate transporter receptor subunit TctC
MIGVGTPAAFAPMIQAGKIKVLAVFAPQRSPLAPDIPTAAELGYPDSDAIQWNGLSGPPGMSPEIIALWHKTVQELIADPAVIAKLATIGMAPNPGDGAAMKKIVADETERCGACSRSANDRCRYALMCFFTHATILSNMSPVCDRSGE